MKEPLVMNVPPRSWELYPKNRSPLLDLTLFHDPTSEYRGTPFWAWNNKLDREQLFRQIDYFQQMGFGGAHMHSRTGMATEYMGDEFLAIIKTCVERFGQRKMFAWLYDEDRWPSGFAGGLVTQDERFAARHLRFTCRPDGAKATLAHACPAKRRLPTMLALVARYEVVLKNGYLTHYRRLADGESATQHGTIWSAYLEKIAPRGWLNNHPYVNVLSRPAIERFIQVTHARYAAVVGEHFGTLIPAIFTDEPQLAFMQALRDPADTHDLIVPFTDDFLATYRQAYGQDLADHLPELLWQLPGGKASVARYRYHDHLSERFAEAFSDTIGRWCAAHGMALTGHLVHEQSLESQTVGLGEAMRLYRSFQIPGIDILCDAREYTTAKQAQSAAHQYGRSAVTSELYGVTNWDYDFVGHKGQGDWQAALGVTVRVPHLAWVSMAGEAKRDYPASIGYQSPWYKEYKLVEDHFSRLNTVLTRGRPGVRVGVIHPVESYWLAFGPLQQTKLERAEREQAFANITEWLLFGLVDFDYICEALLPSLCLQQDGTTFNVGCMNYEVVLVPHMRTIRATTLDRLERFADAGGRVVFVGEIPSLVDAESSARPGRLAERCMMIGLTRHQVLAAVTPCRDVEVTLADGSPTDSLLYQMRIDGEARHVFLCNINREAARNGARIRIKEHWNVTMLDTLTGTTHHLVSQIEGESTVFEWDFPAHGSLLITLGRERKPGGMAPDRRQWVEHGRLADPVPITLSEPNVLLLDQAQWRLNDEPWNDREEILRIDNHVRARFDIQRRDGEEHPQTWTDRAPAPVLGQLGLRFVIHSEVDVAVPQLAMEKPQAARIQVDGQVVPGGVTGWFVDEAIQTVPLPRLSVGEHEIVLTIPFTRKSDIEWCYLLGDFGVAVAGRHARLVAPVRLLAFGDWTAQGLPFYAGNVTYHCRIDAAGGPMIVETAKFKSPLLSVELNGKPFGKIAFAPFQLDLGVLSKGAYRLDITAYGNRVNAFGAMHCCDDRRRWWGPDAWRTRENTWAYEYQLRPMGVMVAPLLKVPR